MTRNLSLKTSQKVEQSTLKWEIVVVVVAAAVAAVAIIISFISLLLFAVSAIIEAKNVDRVD